MQNRPLLHLLLLGLFISMGSQSSQAADVSTSTVGFGAKVGTKSIRVIGADASRCGIIFANPSETRTITLVPGNQTAVSGEGLPIKPLGERWFMGDCKLIKFSSAWNAIADDGTDNPLEIIELR
jgi:hypothetical protein